MSFPYQMTCLLGAVVTGVCTYDMLGGTPHVAMSSAASGGIAVAMGLATLLTGLVGAARFIKYG